MRRAFEIKVSTCDVLTELRNPDKRWMAYAVSHEFYFVTPAGLIDPKLLTKNDGLIEWTGTELKTVKFARVREAMPPRWDFVAAITRRVKEMEDAERIRRGALQEVSQDIPRPECRAGADNTDAIRL